MPEQTNQQNLLASPSGYTNKMAINSLPLCETCYFFEYWYCTRCHRSEVDLESLKGEKDGFCISCSVATTKQRPYEGLRKERPKCPKCKPISDKHSKPVRVSKFIEHFDT